MSSGTTGLADLVRLTELMDLSGRVAVVTGAGRGIGATIAARLAEAGALVHVTDVDGGSADATATEISSRSGRAVGHRLDVRDVAAIAGLARDIAADHGSLDIWVNNAGIFPAVPLFGDYLDTWDQIMQINLRAVFAGTREAARQMIVTHRPGVVVNLASIATHRGGHPSMTPYSASKAGVESIVRSAATALGAHGIRVVGVSPGVVMTPGLREQLGTLENSGGSFSDRGASIPLGRVVEPDDIARAVLFLASDMAAFITGQTIVVDGGDVVTSPSGGSMSLETLGFAPV